MGESYFSQTDHQTQVRFVIDPSYVALAKDLGSLSSSSHALAHKIKDRIRVKLTSDRFSLNKIQIYAPVLGMLSRESRHEIFGFWQRDFTKPFMLKSVINSYSLQKKNPHRFKNKKKLSRCILDEHTCNWFHIYFITLSGSYVRSLFSKSKPASDRVGEPVNEVAGNFLRNRLYLKEQASGKKHDITTMQSRKNKRNH